MFLKTQLRVSAVVAALSACLSVPASGQVTIPDRPGTRPVFTGQPADRQSSEIAFDAATGIVTMKVSVQDLQGSFIPNLRRNNFAVFEDGVRQQNVTVEVEHAPLTVAVLVEMGGRSQQLNQRLELQAPYVAGPIVDMLGRNDRLAVFTYADRLHPVIGLDTPQQQWDGAFVGLKTAGPSEANFYDAAIEVLDRLSSVAGRKALVVVTTGIDTFSRATLDDVVAKARQAGTPVYTFSLGELVRSSGVLDPSRGPLARVDWKECTQQLERLARASGGRAYVANTTLDVPAIYDDLMEDLRVRYVLTYVPSQPRTTAAAPRTVEVRLVDARTGEPLRIVDASGRRVTARVIATATYTPAATTTMSWFR